ncbi:MAG: magnesium-translocating P-type ATPase [Thermoproteota archaeon]
MQKEIWELSPDEVFSVLGTSPQGLKRDEYDRRFKKYGLNEIPAGKEFSSVMLFIKQFRSPLLYILIFAAIIAGMIGELTNATIILVIVIANSMLGFLLERKSSKALEKLSRYVRYSARVIRDGKKTVVDSAKLVPGDLVELIVGDIVPADIRLVSCENFTTNESALTGESLPVEKTAEPIKARPIPQELLNFAFMGTSVISGIATGVVVSTGRETFFGKATKYLAEEEETEFSRNIARFSRFLIEIVVIMVIFVFLTLLLKEGRLESSIILDSLLFALALAVGITPEALPFVVTISLSMGSLKMAKKKVVVKRLDSIEDIGNMDVLCTDKTGTLTENVITVESFFTVDNKPSEIVIELAAVASDVTVQRGKAVGNPIDSAVCNYVLKKFGQDRISPYKRIQLIPFDFSRRRMSVIVEKDGRKMLISKGAPEAIIPICKDVHVSGATEPISNLAESLREIYTTWSRSGYRVISVAFKELSKVNSKHNEKYSPEDERDLTFIGFVTLLDPPKKDAMRAIIAFKRLRIDLKIVSGDEPNVTAEVCRSVGLPVEGGRVITGSELEGMSKDQLMEVVEKHNVFARVTPEQKVEIVRVLRENGHVVGFLGDGINDAPALRIADVGISVDTAVDVAKEAADIIILQKRLGVIANGVTEGRKIFGNTIKYIFNTLSANFGNMLTVAFSSVFLPFIPLLPTQVLLLNLLSDAPLLTISTDNVDREYLKSPKRWSIRFLSEAMVFFGLISTLFDLLMIQALLALLQRYEEMKALFRTCWFLLSVLSEMFATFSIRTYFPFYRSKPSGWLIGVTEITFMIVMFVVFSPIGEAFEFMFPPPGLLAIIASILLSYFILLEVVKKPFFGRHGFRRPSPEIISEVKKLRGRIGALRRKLKRLEQLRDSGKVSENAYLTLSTELEEDIRTLRERLKELLQG